MAHNFVDPTQVVRTAIALVRDDLVLASTINRDYEDEFGGGKGSVVNVRVPATLKARTENLGTRAAIVADDVTESTVPVTLTKRAYSAVFVSDELLTLNIEDFARQVLSPQTISLVEEVENTVVATMQALPETSSIAYDAANPAATFTVARKALRDLGIPQTGLVAAAGTGVYADLLEAKAISDVSQSGSSAALRDAQVGKVRGFTTLEDNRLGDQEIVFYHRDAFTLAIRAPKVPDGVAFGRSLSENGFALRWVKDYDSTYGEDRSIVTTFIGCKAMQIKRLAADGTASMVTPALRVDTSTPVV